MKRLLIVLLLVSGHAYSNCSKFEYNKIDYDKKLYELENKEFCILYSKDKKIPILVYSKHNNTNVQKREDTFKEDKRIENKYRSKIKDYYNSGYDRGHLFASADATSTSSMKESFLLTNIAPQNPKFNRISWRLLEEKIRNLKHTYVYTGVIPGNSTIGNGVNVPSSFYKIIILKECYYGYIGSNSDGIISKISLEDLYKLNNINFNIRLKECAGEL